jgi:IS1 family transposase
MRWKLLEVKKNKIWLWTVVNKHNPGVIAWVLGDGSSETFKLLWQIINCWHSYFYVTDGYPVYPCFISNEDHIVSKTYMTRVEGENSRCATLLGACYVVKLFVTLSPRKCLNYLFD